MKWSTKHLLAACALIAASPATAGVISNGGFEQGAWLGGGSLGQQIADGDSNTLTFWEVNVTAPPGDTPGSLTWYETGFNNLKQIALAAHGGNFAVDLANNDGSVRFIGQMINTLPFQEYEVSFWIGNYSANGGPASINATVRDGTSNTIIVSETRTASLPPQGSNWERVSFPFVSDGTSNTITFSETPGLGYDLSYVGLDDVNIAGIPEPSVWILALAGFGALGLTGLRRPRAARPA